MPKPFHIGCLALIVITLASSIVAATSMTPWKATLLVALPAAVTLFLLPRLLTRGLRTAADYTRNVLAQEAQVFQSATFELYDIRWLPRAANLGPRARLLVDCAIQFDDAHPQARPWNPEMLRLFSTQPAGDPPDIPVSHRGGPIDADEPDYPQATIESVHELLPTGLPGRRLQKQSGSARLRVVFNCPDDLGQHVRLAYFTHTIEIAPLDLPPRTST